MNIKIAAVHMKCVLGNVEENMKTALKYIIDAKEKGAELILFPEFFNTGFAFNTKILEAVKYNDNPQKLLSKWSKEYNIIIGSSYLNYNGLNTLNTFSLTFPNGSVFKHSKDIPTAFEGFCYAPGDEENILETPIGNIGIALCFEQIRYNTLRRMNGKADLILACSCWWSFTQSDGDIYKLNKKSAHIAEAAPVNIAKILSVPVVHSSFNAQFEGINFFDNNIKEKRTILGATQFIDAKGNVLSIKKYNDKPGIIVQNVNYNKNLRNIVDLPQDKYWISEFSPQFNDIFFKLNNVCSEYYEKISKPFYNS